MKISELIKSLQYELDANGDCEVMLAVGIMKPVIIDGEQKGVTMDTEGHETDAIVFNREINAEGAILFLQNFPY
jgi:hypothetical protein